jgi:hypothetical protein
VTEPRPGYPVEQLGRAGKRGRPPPRVVIAGDRAEVFFRADELDFRMTAGCFIGASVGGSVVHHDDRRAVGQRRHVVQSTQYGRGHRHFPSTAR